MKDTANKKYEKLFEDNELDAAATAVEKEHNENVPVKEVRFMLNYDIAL